MFVFLALVVCVIGSEVAADGCCVITSPKRPRQQYSVAEAFRRYEIVDDYIDEPPTDLFMVKLQSAGDPKLRDIEVTPGIKLSPLRTYNPPQLKYPKGDDKTLYTALLVDIDPPSRENPTKRAFINGIFVNSPASDLSKGDVVVAYTPAIPDVDTGYHRFVGLLYEQNDTIDVDTEELCQLARNRYNFSALDFASKYNLGSPVAGNFFLAENSICGLFD